MRYAGPPELKRSSKSTARDSVAHVILDLKSSYNKHYYTYSIPEHLLGRLNPGATVIVPVRREERLGYVVKISADAGEEGGRSELRAISGLVEGAPAIKREQLELCLWIADYYLANPNETLKLVLPTDSRHKLVEHGGAERSFTLEAPPEKKRTVEYAAAKNVREPGNEGPGDGHVRGPKQRAVLESLRSLSPQPVRELLATHNTSRATLKSLVDKGLVEISSLVEEREYDTSFTNPVVKKITLNADQEAALARISGALKSHSSASFLLEGVTGSGKTEVYLRAASLCLAQSRSVIFLVPEIALLPQIAERLAMRFGNQVAVIHSALKAGERADALRAVSEGRKKIIVGARSALFAPVDNLGLIVLDEEHETSYKQNSVPRYDARRAALKLAELHGAVVVYGSATPSLETGHSVSTDGSHRLSLHNRASGLHFPEVNLVDMRKEVGVGNYGIFSRHLIERLTTALDSGHKAILLINRRGFANFVLCRPCGYVPECRDCSISMTYHRSNDWLRCHHCGAAGRVPAVCPKCGAADWHFGGVGTQRVEAELPAAVPGATVIRMDADTTGAKRGHHHKLLEFLQTDRAVLLGTQMVAKGLDFPEVALVGIINADTALNLPDFRAAERTAQLLIQVSGRSGRGSIPGEVIVQTFSPENYAIQAATGGYGEFYEKEMSFRRELDYPPFSSMINIIFSGRDQRLAAAETKRISEHLRESLSDVAELLGPAPAPIERVKGFWRHHLILRTNDPETLKDRLRDEKVLTGVKDLRVIIDVDPVWLL